MKRGWKIGLAVLLALPCAYALFLAFNFGSIEFDLWRRGAVEVRPTGGGKSIAEEGLVMAVRRVRNIRQKQFSLEWLVIVASTGTGYSCEYQDGFAGFEKGDSVTLVHTPAEMDEPDAAAYLIGQRHDNGAKAARVEPFELDRADANSVDP